jgi:uncharacterized protein (DUF1330 family)
LRAYGDKFLLHGEPYHQIEGVWSSDLIVIEFADMASALGWHNSPQYQKIKPLRTNSTTGAVFLVEGAPKDHRASDIFR